METKRAFNRELTTEQMAFFDSFGFLRLSEVFGPDEVLSISRECLEIFQKDRGNRAFDGTWRQQIGAFVEHSATLAPLATDARIFGPVKQLLNEDCIWIGSDGNLYAGDTGWHPDGSNSQYRRVKALIYLEPTSKDSGALRVIVGSHREPLHSELRPLLQRSDVNITPYGVVAPLRDQVINRPLGVSTDELPYVCVGTMPGDVVFFDQNIWHASYYGRAGRMMFTLNYGASPSTPEQIDFVRQMYSGQLHFCTTMQSSPRHCLFPKTFVQANDKQHICGLLRTAEMLGYVSAAVM